MKSCGKVLWPLVLLLGFSLASVAGTAMAVVKLDLANPSTGNPADQDPIAVSAGGTLTIHIRLTSGTDQVASTGNEIGFDSTVFSSPQATVGTVASNAGKIVSTNQPSAGIFRVGVFSVSNANVIADGVVAILTFTVANDATPGDYTLTNELISSSDPNGYDLATTGSNATIRVILNNPPVVNAGADRTADEGSSVSVSASFTDADTTDTHTATINWGDGTTASTGTVTESGGSGTVSGSHTYTDNGTFAVTVTVTDNFGLSGSDTLIVTVSNAAPTVNAGPNMTANEGSSVSLSASFTDQGSVDTHTATINWGDGTTGSLTVNATARTVSGSHAYRDNGAFTVTLAVTDDDGAVGTGTFTVTVNNVAPTVNAGAGQTINEGATVTLSASFFDPGSADTHTATINWGDGTTEAGTVNETAWTVTGSHAYASQGTFPVIVTVADDDGGAGTDTLIVTVSSVASTGSLLDGQYAVTQSQRCVNSPGGFTGPEDSYKAILGAWHQEIFTDAVWNFYKDEVNQSNMVKVHGHAISFTHSTAMGATIVGETEYTCDMSYTLDSAGTSFTTSSVKCAGESLWPIKPNYYDPDLAAKQTFTVESDRGVSGRIVGNGSTLLLYRVEPIVETVNVVTPWDPYPEYSFVRICGSSGTGTKLSSINVQGDINGDGAVDVLDAIKVLRMSLGLQ